MLNGGPQVNRVETTETDGMEWLMHDVAQDEDEDQEGGGTHQRSMTLGKAKDSAALSSRSSTFDEEDGDLDVLYSINSSAT